MSYAPHISDTRVRSIIHSCLNRVDVPMNVSFNDLGFSNSDLQNIQRALVRHFNRTVGTIFFADTIYSLTERLNGKKA